jgi:hypothetical protein
VVDGAENLLTMMPTTRLRHTIPRTRISRDLAMVPRKVGGLVSGLVPWAVQQLAGLHHVWVTEETRLVVVGATADGAQETVVAAVGTTAKAARGHHLVIASRARGMIALASDRRHGDREEDIHFPLAQYDTLVISHFYSFSVQEILEALAVANIAVDWEACRSYRLYDITSDISYLMLLHQGPSAPSTSARQGISSLPTLTHVKYPTSFPSA